MILSRIKEFIDFKGISVAAFEKSIGVANASFAKPLKVGGNIGSDKLENILRIYTDLNPVWLMTGQGKMLIDVNIDNKNREVNREVNGEALEENTPMVSEPAAQYERSNSSFRDNGLTELIRDLVDQLKEQSEEIGALRQENAALKHRLAQIAEDVGNASSVPA